MWVRTDNDGFVTYFAREPFNIHTDHLNTPRRMTRSAGSSYIWIRDSRGQIYDSSYGRHYNYMRDYDPYTGRYIESDPLGLNGGSYSPYACVAGNRVANSDKLGLLVCNGRWRRMGELVPTLGISWQMPGWARIIERQQFE